MLKLKNIKKLYRAGDVVTAALRDVTLEIAHGDYVAITGPSGCGKSTLLNILGLLDVPDEGQYQFDGHAAEGMSEWQLNELRRGKVGFIFQSFNLIDELTVAENVALALEYTGAPDKRNRVTQMLDQLGLAHRAGHYPSQLSGGQQQRVAIARALVARPLFLLADEPTGNLDKAHGEEVMALLQEINAEGTTVVMVTHSAEHAAQAGRIVHMLDGRVQLDQLKHVA
jgi:putative ABC transport system ATP-binding protein